MRTWKGLLTGLVLLTALPAFAQQQTDIWALMNRRDLRLSEIDALAKKHFDEVGRVRGTGFKQYERWKYEKQFHLDSRGFILPDNYDANQYQATSSSLLALDAAAGAWTEVGPKQWNRTTSWNPGVGQVNSIAVFPSNPNIIYVSTPGGGIWKSTQGGNLWVSLCDNLNNLMSTYSVAVDPLNSNNVFAGNSGSIFRSTDGGSTWSAKVSNAGTVRNIQFHPTNPQILFGASTGGIYKSTDGGNSWVRKSTANVEDLEFHPGNPDTLYASGSLIYRSTNGGETWTQLTSTNGITNSGRTLLAVSAADPRVVYAVQASGSLFGRFYRSNDAGTSFVTTIIGSPSTCTNFFGYGSNGCDTRGQAGYDMAITANPDNANEVHIAGIICWKSLDAGVSFTATTEWYLPNSRGYNHADVHVLEWVGNTIYSGSDGGIYKSTDLADNWSDLSNGLGIRQFYRIATANTSNTLVTGGAQDNGSSIFKASGWIDWLGADGMDCLFSPLDSNLIWGTSQYGSLYRSMDGGNSYSSISIPRSGNWVTPLAIESNSNIIYGGWKGVWKSTNLGSTWTLISKDTSNYSVLAVAPSNPNYIYASNGSVLHVTKDGGTNWTSYVMSSGISITSVAIHPSNPDKIWISSNSTTNRVFVSANAGATFTNISYNLPAYSARSVVVDDTPDEGLYMAMNIGVYYLNKNMTSWVNLTDNLPLVSINEVEIQKKTGVIRVGTYGRGIWERSAYSTCSPPTGLSTTQVTAQGATLNWVTAPGAAGYTVDYKASSSNTWINILNNGNTNSFTLTGLNAATSYDWRISTLCNPGTSSYATATFTTSIPCGKPTNLVTSAITRQSAELSWTGFDTALSYTLEFKTGNASWALLSNGLTGNTYSWTGLSEGTAYQWRVNATCTQGSGSFDSAQFVTAVTCNTPSNLNTTNITATLATLNWSSVTGASGYDIDTRISGGTWANKASNLTGISYSLTGLTGGNNYEWRIRSNCGSLSGNSSYDSTSFSTAVPACSDAYEPNNTFTAAKNISFNAVVNGLIPAVSDSDLFKFTTPNNLATNVRISLFNLPADYNIYMYNKNLALIGSSTRSGTQADTIILNSTAKRALYYVKVSPASGTFHSTVCYSLKVENNATAYPTRTAPTYELPGLLNTSQQLSEATLRIFPVPARQSVTIDYWSMENTPAQIQLYDITGRVLQNRIIDVKSGANRYSLETGSYPDGMYLIKMTLPNTILNHKLMIRK